MVFMISSSTYFERCATQLLICQETVEEQAFESSTTPIHLIFSSQWRESNIGGRGPSAALISIFPNI
jgi:hypothetical protein